MSEDLDEVGADPARFTEWVAPHWSAITGLAHRLADPAEVEDVVQETVLLAWRKRHRFDPGRGTARTWLLALTADQARRSRRRRWRSARVAEQDPDPHTDVPADVDLARALDRLTGRQRLAVELFYYLDLPVAEVAAVMGCSDGTVKSTLSAARAKLRAELGDDHR